MTEVLGSGNFTVIQILKKIIFYHNQIAALLSHLSQI